MKVPEINNHEINVPKIDNPWIHQIWRHENLEIHLFTFNKIFHPKNGAEVPTFRIFNTITSKPFELSPSKVGGVLQPLFFISEICYVWGYNNVYHDDLSVR